MRISGLDELVSKVSSVFCDHSIRVAAAPEKLRSDFKVQDVANQPLVELQYGAPVSVDAEDFRDLYLVCHATAGAAQIEQEGRSIELAPRQTIIMSPGLRTKLELDSSFSQVSLRLNVATVEQACTKLLGRPLDEPIRFQLDPLAPALSQQWTTLLRLLHQQAELELSNPSRTSRVMEDFLVTWLLTSQAHNYRGEFESGGASPEPAIVRRAERIIRENAATGLTIVELAHMTGVSLRTLQAAFKTWRSTTPSAFMRDIKLTAARQKLLSSDVASIADVALEAGFAHIGRFSESYRRVFGETPSATVRQTKLRNGR